MNLVKSVDKSVHKCADNFFVIFLNTTAYLLTGPS